MKSSKKKKIIKISIIVVLVFLIFATAFFIVVKYLYGSFSIPSWFRSPHKALREVENYHSNLDFEDIDDGNIPRLDIMMDEDYKLGKKDYTGCYIQISNAEQYNMELTEAQIRIRGNSTSSADKKPYKIKFQDKISVFGGGKEKSWVLLANTTDITGIHNYVSMELYRHLAPEGTFIPMVRFVNLYINGCYQGVYNFCDQVETGKTRVPISGKIKSKPEETDYLVVNDQYASCEGEEGLDWFWLDKSITPIEIKSPDTSDEKYNKEYTEYLKNRLEEIYDVILSKDWEAIQNCVDIDSIINGFLVSIIADNPDIAYKSIYYYLPAGGKLTFGPVWDMDLTYGAGTSSFWVNILGEKSELNAIWRQLMKVPEFREVFTARFKTVYKELESFIVNKIHEAVNIAGKELENEFLIRSSWGRYGSSDYVKAQTYDEAIDYMINWTHERLEYLYSNYGE